MKLKKLFLLELFLFIGMIAASLILWTQLPEQMPMHWNIEGQIDNYMPKIWGAFMVPGIAILLMALFKFIPFIDPKKEKYKLFEKSWGVIQFGIYGFMAYMHFVTLYLSINQSADIVKLILPGIGVLFILLGNYMTKVRQNYFVGIKTPWTLNNEEVWNKTHRVGGLAFVIAGIVFLIEGFFQVYMLPVFLITIILAALGPVIYSYFVFRKLKK
jgi:uncharacterized membrane protein